MRKITFVLLACLFAFQFNAKAQELPNNNGQLDLLEEFSSPFTVPFIMPDGIKLMTDITVPVLRDCLLITLDTATLNGFFQGLGTQAGEDVSIELLKKGTQLFVYDSLNGQVNPNPYQLPIIFTRTPYNKKGDVAGKIIALFGYGYALQDMRGRYSSEGVYMPMYSDSWNKNPYHGPQFGAEGFKHVLDLTDYTDPMNGNKHEDGWNSVEFMVNDLYREYDINQNGTIEPNEKFLACNGSVGMFGASALGNTQYQAAAAHPIDPNGPGLKGLMPIVATNEHFLYTGYQNGVFRERIVTGWIKGQIFDVEDDKIDIDTDIQNNLHTSFDYGLPNKFDAAKNAIDHFVETRYGGGVAGYYPNSRGRAGMDASDAFVDANGEGDIDGGHLRYENMDVPAYHLTGWWDIFTDGQIATWDYMRRYIDPASGNQNRQKLVIGPWAHQTIGSTTTGDVTYPDNVVDIMGFDLSNVEDIQFDIDALMNSEIIGWMRYSLNYNEYANIGLPTVLIPEDQTWQTIPNTSIELRIPSEPYRAGYEKLINYLLGNAPLPGMKGEIRVLGNVTSVTVDLPSSGEPLLADFSSEDLIDNIDSINFDVVPDIRFYVPGPVDDGVAENAGLGNYWFGADTFPIVENITRQDLYFHQNGTLNYSAPTTDEGYTMYVHDPDDPILTVGGANMIVDVPGGGRDSQGQIDMSNPLYAPHTKDRQGVIAYEMDITSDSFSIVGFPVVTMYAKSNPGGANNGDPTDTDFFVRLTDVYPDGRELFVVDGCVNARGRDFARHFSELEKLEDEDPTIPFTNIEAGKLYEYKFQTMPIAYTWGKGHKMRILVSSSNYNRYQVNPNIPIQDGDFFRRQPADGQSYMYNGVEMEPRIAVQRIHHSLDHPTHISLPVYSKSTTSVTEGPQVQNDLQVSVYPNPAVTEVTVNMTELGKDYDLRVVNMIGQEVYFNEFNGTHTIDVKGYDSGTYFIEVTEHNNVNSKIVKKVTVL